MDIKKIALAVALMLGMAAVPMQAVNAGDLVKRVLCIGGGVWFGSTALTLGPASYIMKKFNEAATADMEKFDKKVFDVDPKTTFDPIKLVSSVSLGVAIGSGIISGLLFYLGLKK